MENKKILIINYWLNICGVSRVLANLANSLQTEGYDVTIKFCIDDMTMKNELSSDIKIGFLLDRFAYFRNNKKGSKRLYMMFIRLAKYIPAKILSKIVINEDYDAVIAYNRGLSTKIVSGWYGERKFAFVHNDYRMCSGITDGFTSFKSVVSAYKKFKSIACVSDTAKDGFIEHMGITENVTVLNNVNDEEKIFMLAKEPVEFDKTVLNIVAVGRLSREKDYIKMLDCAKLLSEDGINFRLRIIGDGDQRQIIEKYISDNKIENVILLGSQMNPYKYVANSDIYIISSIYEGLSTTVIEALILGTPVVACNCCGMTDILGEGNEFGIITNNDYKSLFQGIKLLISDKKLYDNYSKKAKERGIDFYKRNIITKFTDLIFN